MCYSTNVYNLLTFLMNKVSWWQHVSSFSSSTETSNITLWTHKYDSARWCSDHRPPLDGAPWPGKQQETYSVWSPDLTLTSLAALWCRSMSDVRMDRTSRRISGSSIRVKDSRGSKKDEGKAVRRLVLSWCSDTWDKENQPRQLTQQNPCTKQNAYTAAR